MALRATPDNESSDLFPDLSHIGFLVLMKNQSLTIGFRDKNKRLLHDSRLFPRCRSRGHIARGASRARGKRKWVQGRAHRRILPLASNALTTIGSMRSSF